MKYTKGPWKYDTTYGLIVTKHGDEIAACHSGIAANGSHGSSGINDSSGNFTLVKKGILMEPSLAYATLTQFMVSAYVVLIGLTLAIGIFGSKAR